MAKIRISNIMFYGFIGIYEYEREQEDERIIEENKRMEEWRKKRQAEIEKAKEEEAKETEDAKAEEAEAPEEAAVEETGEDSAE